MGLGASVITGAAGGAISKPVAKLGVGTARVLSPKIASRDVESAVRQLPQVPLSTPLEAKLAPNVKVTQRAPGIAQRVRNDLNTIRETPVRPETPTPPETPQVRAQRALVTPRPIKETSSPTAGSVTDDLATRIAGLDITPEEPKVRAVNRLIGEATGGRATTLGEIYKSGVVDPIRTKANETIYKGISSPNRAVAAVSQTPRLISSRVGLTDKQRSLFRQFNDAKTNAGRVLQEINRQQGDRIANTGNIEETNKRIFQVLEEPKYLTRRYGEGTPKLTRNDLNDAEKEILDNMIEVNKIRNDTNLRIGQITPELHAKYADGTHSPRIYDMEFDSPRVGKKNPVDVNPSKQRKNIEDVSDKAIENLLDSPVQGSLIRAEIALRNQAGFDLLTNLQREGLILDEAPNKGFSQLTGKRYGPFEGKFVDNQTLSELEGQEIFNTDTGKLINDLLDKYRYSKLGAADRLQKSFKTTLAPATGLGNIMSNILGLNRGAGVSAPVQAANMAKAGADLAQHRSGKKFSKEIYEASKYGVFSDDSGKSLIGDNTPNLQVTQKSTKNPYKIAGAIYGGVDDAAKLAIWRNLRRKGLSPEKTAERVAQFTQDYGNAGRLIQTLADSPVIGKPFARFIPELVRITKNNAIYNPLGVAAGFAAFAIAQNELSKAAGETPEQREARETAVGQTLIPGTAWLNKLVGGPDRELSLNFAIGDSSTNLARVLGMNFPQEPGGNANTALINSLIPFANPTRKDADGDLVFAPSEIISSLAFKPIAEQITNQDFMGRQITDPTNKTYYEDGNIKVRKFGDEPSSGEQGKNRLKALGMAHLPFANETQSVVSAAQGKEDYYGKERSLGEGILRAGGFKTESNSPEAREKRVDTKAYFEGDVKRVNEFLNNNPDLAPLYYQFDNPTRDRKTGIKSSDLISPERWALVKSDTSGRLFNFLKEEQLAQNEKDGKPVDPVYTLDPKRAKTVIDLRTRPSGDDIETEEILRATQSWYPQFEQAERDYYAANQAYFSKITGGKSETVQNPRVKEYNEVEYPQQSQLVQDYYRIKAENEQAGKQFYKENADALSKEFDSYKNKRLQFINAKRGVEGYDPIPSKVFSNVTFGFEPDERKVSKSLSFKAKQGKLTTGGGEGDLSGGDGGAGTFGSGGSRSGKVRSRKIRARKLGGGGRIRAQKVRGVKPRKVKTSVTKPRVAKAQRVPKTRTKVSRTRIQ